jgi:ATP-binding cassette subfamily B (MDR/TAP) protein 1
MWGVLFSEMIDLLFRRVELCPDAAGLIPEDYPSCDEYWQETADLMQERSFEVAGFWAILITGCIVGNVLTFWGFGTASERLNKRVRDSSFSALMRQEVGFFDKRSVGKLTSQLQDDAARIHAFSGEPVRSLLIALASVVTGVTLSFIVSFLRMATWV